MSEETNQLFFARYRVTGGPVKLSDRETEYKVRDMEWETDMTMTEVICHEPEADKCEENYLEAFELGSHPYIAFCYGVRRENNKLYMFTENCGRSLHDMITDGSLYTSDNVIDFKRIFNIAQKTIIGIEYAHNNKSIMHGGICPRNILIGEDDSVKLTRFTNAYTVSAPSYSIDFASPEHYSLSNGISADLVTYSSDIYSWALTMVALLKKCIPRRTNSTDPNRIVNGMRINFNMFNQILSRCLMHDPDDRPTPEKIIGDLNTLRGILQITGDNILNILAEKYQKFSESPNSICNRAVCLADAGCDDKAEELWKQLSRNFPMHSGVKFNYSMFLWQHNRLDDSDLFDLLDRSDNVFRRNFLSEFERAVKGATRERKVYTVFGNYAPEEIVLRFSKDSKELLIPCPGLKKYVSIDIKTCMMTGSIPLGGDIGDKWAEPGENLTDPPDIRIMSPDGKLYASFSAESEDVSVCESQGRKKYKPFLCHMEYYPANLLPMRIIPPGQEDDDEDDDDDTEDTDTAENYSDRSDAPDHDDKDDDNMDGKNRIDKITDEISIIRAELLRSIKGQEHAVNAFCEGLWRARVFGSADKKRQRPSAVYLFAGPPGVGKTYLAMTAADLIKRPFKSFNMGSYSDELAHKMLTGYAKTFQNHFPGHLTGFVKKNPNAVLLFDEIEKADQNVHKLFLSILDLGTLTDNYYDETVSFADTTIIFTTNLGKSLYNGKLKANCSKIPPKLFLNALCHEINPRFGQPYFKPELVSRFGMGYPIVFNHLSPHTLIRIAEKQFNDLADRFRNEYGITVTADKAVLMSLMFREGGRLDARNLCTNVVKFFESEVMKLFNMRNVSTDSGKIVSIKDFDSFHFIVEEASGRSGGDDTDDKDLIRRLFRSKIKPNVLIFARKASTDALIKYLPDINFHAASSVEEALAMLGDEDIKTDMVIIDAMITDETKKNESTNKDPEATSHLSPAARKYKKGRELLSTVIERLPEMPVYLLEDIDEYPDTLLRAFIAEGVRDKIIMPEEDDTDELEETINMITSESFMLEIADDLDSTNKIITFETAPHPNEAEKSITLELRNFRNISSDYTPEKISFGLIPEFNANLLSGAEKPADRFSDIVGLDKAVDELRTVVNYLGDPVKYRAKGFVAPKGVLMYGPPGTGKTMLARATAGESSVSFLACNASEFVTKYAGSGPTAIRELFDKARNNAPAIVFIDEVNAIGKMRTGSEMTHLEESTLEALFTEMDGFDTHSKNPVVVIAATNFGIKKGDGGIAELDSGFVRRFNKKLKIDLPDKKGRVALLTAFIGKIPNNDVSPDIIDNIAERAIDQSPANLKTIVENAVNDAAKLNVELNGDILMTAFEVMLYGEEKNRPDEESLRHTAIHECGHTVNYLETGFVPSYLTIEARENFGGYMMPASDDIEGTRLTRADLLAKIRTALGGRAAELVYYGSEDGLTTGASKDLEDATRYARLILTRFGMDDENGLCTLEPSDTVLRRRINAILDREMKNSTELIERKRLVLDNLTTALVEMKRLTNDQIKVIVSQKRRITAEKVRLLLKKKKK
ncbi:MAG: AAA family ATPase [Ruminiclostridium sp.]|nr:AAA family ATPase [Ruminiclostridium sp.]